MNDKDCSHLIDLSLTEVKGIVKKYAVDKKLSKSAFHVISFDVKRIGEETVGFLGDHFILNVLVKDKYVKYDHVIDEEEILTFFVKSFPEYLESKAAYLQDFRVFDKETNLYNTLIPRLQDVGIGGGRSWAPRCYLVKQNTLMVMENLQLKNYKIAPFNNGILSYNHLEVALITVAKFHAASFVVELRNKKTIPNLYPSSLYENAYVEGSINLRNTHFQNAIKVCCEFIKVIPKYRDSEHLERIVGEFPSVIKKIYEFIKPSEKYKNVVNHADLWVNNIMYKYTDSTVSADTAVESNQIECEVHRDPSLETISVDALEILKSRKNEAHLNGNGKHEMNDLAVACKLVDFQLSRYAAPGLDVMTLICLTTSEIFRKNNLNTLLDVYYEALTSELDRNEFDVADILPYDLFQESCQYYRHAGLIEAALFNHLILLPPDITKNITSTPNGFKEFIEHSKIGICMKVFETNENYRSRMTEVISLLVDDYILDVNN